MIDKNLIINETSLIKFAMIKLSKSAKKCLVVLDKDHKLLGTLTDGDIRRAILKGKNFNNSIKSIYKKKPLKVYNNKKNLNSIKKLMLRKKIDFIPIVNNSNKFVNFVTWDLLNKKDKRKKKLKDVDVIIMAGGKGTRLKPFTNVLPKPLIPLGNKTVIENIIEKFSDHGHRKFYVSINYKSKIIKSYFQEIKPKYKIYFIKEKKPMGTIGCLKNIKTSLKKNLFICNCDTIMNFDYSKLLNFHNKNLFDITIVAARKKIILPYGICNLKDKIYLKSIDEKPTNQYMVNTGMYVLRRTVIKELPKKNKIDIDELISILLKKNKKVGVFKIEESNWNDVGVWPMYQQTISKLVQK